MENKEKINMEVCREEKKFIEYCRKVKYCEMKLLVRHGKPVKCYESMQSVRFDIDSE